MSSEKLLVIRQVVNPEKDWLKLFTGEWAEPAVYEVMQDGTYLYSVFACGGKHLYFCLCEKSLDLKIPRDCMESLNQVEAPLWDEMTLSDWYLKMLAITAGCYKEE